MSFTILGANFQPGNTTVEFRNESMDLIPTTLTAVSAGGIVGTVTIPKNAPLGLRNVRVVTTAGGENISVNAVTVTKIPKPTMTGISPAIGYRNTTVSYTITGTNFLPGQTTVVFRNISGKVLNVTTLKSVTSTMITGTIVIPRTAWVGPYNVSISTIDGGTTPGSSGDFRVAQPPTITSISPVTGYPNTTVSYMITGTDFMPGQTSVVFRNASGAELAQTIVLGILATRITGKIAIPRTAWIGPYDIKVNTTDSGSALGTKMFTVVPRPAPTITSISPVSGYRNSTFSYTIVGTNFIPGQTTVVFRNASGTELVPSTVNILSATTITGMIAIPRTAWIGPYNVSVRTVDGGSTLSTKVLTVAKRPAPTITLITPATGYRNTTVSYAIFGTNFIPGQTYVTFRNTSGSVLNVTTLKSVSATIITGTIFIPRTAWIGAYNVSVRTIDGGSTLGTVAFTVQPSPINAVTITSISPAVGYLNSTVIYTIYGTNFIPGQTSVTFKNAAGTVLNLTTLKSVTATTITGTIAIPRTAKIGSYNVNVSLTDGRSAPGTKLFTVAKRPAPTIRLIIPAIGYRNTTVSYTIYGTDFISGQTNVTFRNTTGAVLNTTSIKSVSTTGTIIAGTIIIPSTSWLGAYNISACTIDGGCTIGTVVFTVIPRPLPTLTSITPSTGLRNATTNYTIVGTNFIPGQTKVTFQDASGKVLAPATFNCVYTTSITGSIAIPRTARIGLWDVNISTIDGGSTPGTGKFTVASKPAPAISSISPSIGYQNSTNTYMITGSNFKSGQTSLTFKNTSGNSLIPTNMTIVSAERINVTFVLPSRPWLGAYMINVSTVDGGMSKGTAVYFRTAQMPPPVISTVIPSTAYTNTDLQYTIYGTNFQPNLTRVNLMRTGYTDIPTTVISATQTTISGHILLPSDTATGLWSVYVETVDGGNTISWDAINLLSG